VQRLAMKYRPVELLDGPLVLTVKFILACPGRPKWKLPAVKPDLSNYIKSIEDALNGIIWQDDARIVVCNAQKLYAMDGSKPRIEVRIERVA
jgi:Holliday junction resolvase RusA-like endonuclease